MSDSDRSSRNGPPGEIVFVKQENLVEPSQRETFEQSFEKFQLLADEVPSVSLTENECLKILKKPQSTAYIFANFQGEAFCHLKSLSCCLIGAPLLLSCLEKSLPLPKSRIPIFCDAMAGAIVCCTNIEREKRDDLHNLILIMGGKIKRDFEECCNILVADAVGSQKYDMAAKRKIPILTPGWVEQTWEIAVTGKIFEATSDDFLSKYKCLPFRGLIITVSGLRAEERTKAQIDVVENGGIFCVDLKMGETTHLITNFASGAKYDAAIRWKVKIVKSQWLEDSILCGACMNEDAYSVCKTSRENNQKVSTPTSAGLAAPRFSMLDANCSAISRKDANMTIISNASPSTTTFRVNETGAQFTFGQNQQRPSSSTFVEPKGYNANFNTSKRITPKRVDETATTTTLSTNGDDRTVTDATIAPHSFAKIAQNETPLEDLDLTITSSGDFLSSCRIFVDGFEPNQTDKLRKIVGAGGGQRLRTFDNRVTHVILGKQADKAIVERLRSMKPRPEILIYQWLVRSFKSAKLLPVKEFLHPDFYDRPAMADDFSPVPLKNHATPRVQQPPKAIPVLDLLDDEDLLSQYMEETNEDENIPKANAETDKQNIDSKRSSSGLGRNKRIELKRPESNRRSSVGATEEDAVWDTPSNFTDPNKTFHPNFDLDDAFKYVRSQLVTNCESPSVIVERQLALAVKSTEQAEQFLRSPPRSAIESDDFEMEEPPQGSAFTPARTGPLLGVVICVGKKVSFNPMELHNIVHQLGGTHSWTFDKSCTHFIFDVKAIRRGQDRMSQGLAFTEWCKANDGEYRKAKECGKFIVHPAWLQECQKKSCRIDESSFPCTYNPDKSVVPATAKKFKPNSTQKFSQSKPKTQIGDTPRKTKSEIAVDPFKNSKVAVPSKIGSTKILANVLSSHETNDDVEKKSDTRENVVKSISNVLSRSKTLNSVTSEENEQTLASTSASTPIESLQPKFDLARQQSDSQGLQIGWEDPKQKQERAKIEPLLKPMLEPTQNVMGVVFADEENDDNDDIQLIEEEIRKPETYRFLLTSSDEFKDSCIKIINTLHGVYIDNRNFVPDCTHLIVGKPTRNEKLLSSIATGKWILHPNYLTACQKANKFLPEKDFEWGSSGTENLIASLPTMSQSLARSCSRWRLKISEANVKPYDGWKVILLVDRNLENGLKPLLEYGGAKLLKKDTPAGQLTHAFISENKTSAHQQELKRLKIANVKCLKPEFLAAFLIQDKVNEKEFSV